MFKNVPVSHSIQFQDTKITLETGLLANQATSSVLATIGETTVLAAVVVGKETTGDYFPLQVVYEERMYASGKIKGSRFIKREGRPSENAILIGRMIDRSLRSLFDKSIRHEVQVVVTVLSIDEVNPPDILSVLAASSALKIAVKDFQGPVSSVRIGQITLTPVEFLVDKIKHEIGQGRGYDHILGLLTDACSILDLHKESDKAVFREIFNLLASNNSDWANQLKFLYQSQNRLNSAQIMLKYSSVVKSVVCPSYENMNKSNLDLVVSGDGNSIMMVEAGANIVSEETLGNCLDLAVESLVKLTVFQNEFVQKVLDFTGKEPLSLAKPTLDEKYTAYWEKFLPQIETVLYNSVKKEDRNKNLEEFKLNHDKVLSQVCEIVSQNDSTEGIIANFTKESEKIIAQSILNLVSEISEFKNLSQYLDLALEEFIHRLVQTNILDKDRRLDGRRLDETRKIIAQHGVLTHTHGSSLFQRGETQVLNVLTLGTSRDAQTLDDMEDFEEQTKRYIHHYNFPAYSVGETGRYTGPGRREIGHGALAEKALLPVLPSEEEFPYTMRLVSECLGSNGSTSMASTCASCLSLLDGGVPIKDLVAGVAMGLVLDSKTKKFKVLTDILGDEDHFGDMDFKVTGTKDGITALQLDNKVAGLTPEILKLALVQAKAGRMHILGIMANSIDKPKPEISKYAPGVMIVNIPTDKIGEVIGPSGKIIKSIIAKYQVDLDIEDNTGKTFIYGKNRKNVEGAYQTILALIKDYTAGEIVEGKVFRVENYGAFIKINSTDKEGMIHISQFSDKRVNDINEVVKMGQIMKAKIVEINEKGQISLTLKGL